MFRESQWITIGRFFFHSTECVHATRTLSNLPLSTRTLCLYLPNSWNVNWNCLLFLFLKLLCFCNCDTERFHFAVFSSAADLKLYQPFNLFLAYFQVPFCCWFLNYGCLTIGHLYSNFSCNNQIYASSRDHLRTV